MKHMKKIILAAMAVGVLSVSMLAGCGSSGTADINNTTWKIVSMEGGEGIAEGYELMQSLGVEATVSFKDGVASMSMKGEAFGQKMDETQELGEYDVNEDGSLKFEDGNAKVEGNKMTITTEAGTMVLEKQ